MTEGERLNNVIKFADEKVKENKDDEMLFAFWNKAKEGFKKRRESMTVKELEKEAVV